MDLEIFFSCSLCLPVQASWRRPASLRSALFPARGQIYGASVRSDHRAPQLLPQKGLPRKTQAHPILRQRTQPPTYLLDQQFLPTGANHHQVLQVPLANRVVLQMDQAAPQNQGFLWNLRERCKDSDLGCHLRICAGGNSQETPQFGSEPLHNSTDFKPNTFRENAHFTGSFESRLHN